MASISSRRLAKELREIQAEGCPVGACLHTSAQLETGVHDADTRCNLLVLLGINLVEATDFSKWVFTIQVMGDSLYQVLLLAAIGLPFCSTHVPLSQDEVHTLQFRFDAQYPISSPAVQFVVTDGKQAPIHPVRPSPSSHANR